MNRRALLKSTALALAARGLPLPSWITAAQAQDGNPDKKWRHGLSLFGDLKYPEGFKQFDYVNANAPKGGTARQIAIGTFDNLNIVVAGIKGTIAAGIGLIYDTLLAFALDEVTGAYGLLAEAISYPDDFSSVSYRLRAEAKWHDGMPVTPEDVIFSFDASKKNSPQLAAYYRHVVKVEKTGEREVTFTFDGPGNRELPQIVGEIMVLPKHWWEGTDKNGKKRDVGTNTLEPPLGSSAYRIKDFTAGRTIVYERVNDYWGKNLAVSVGVNNFDELRYDYFRDTTVALEAFKADTVDWRIENVAKNWATAYDFPAVADKRVLLKEFPINSRGVMQAFAFNIRRPKFADPRLRRAFNYAFDFEEMNGQLFYRQYKRVDSYFAGTELAATGLPAAASWKSSKPCATRFRRRCSPRPMPTRSAATRRRCATICARRCGSSRKPDTKSAISNSSTVRAASPSGWSCSPRSRARSAYSCSISHRSSDWASACRCARWTTRSTKTGCAAGISTSSS